MCTRVHCTCWNHCSAELKQSQLSKVEVLSSSSSNNNCHCYYKYLTFLYTVTSYLSNYTVLNSHLFPFCNSIYKVEFKNILLDSRVRTNCGLLLFQQKVFHASWAVAISNARHRKLLSFPSSLCESVFNWANHHFVDRMTKLACEISGCCHCTVLARVVPDMNTEAISIQKRYP